MMRPNSCENDSGDGVRWWRPVVGAEEHRRCRLDRRAFDDETAPPLLEQREGVGIEVDPATAGAGLHGTLDGAAHRGLP